MNKQKKSLKTDSEFLPVKLSEALKQNVINNSNYDYRAKNNFIKCVSLIYYHQLRSNNWLTDYVPLGSNYWKLVYNRHNYKLRIILPLIKMRIIEEHKDHGSYAKGKVLIRYRINPDFLEINEFVKFEYLRVGGASKSVFLNTKNHICSLSTFPRVSIDTSKTLAYIEAKAEDICRSKIQEVDINDLVEDEYTVFLVGNEKKKYHMTSSKIEEEVILKGLQVFKYKNEYHVCDLTTFVSNRTKHIKHHYCREVHKITQTPLIDSINDNNYRLHNTLVTFPSALLPFIKMNDCTMHQFDLRTSQFLLFANLINVYLEYGGNYLLKLFKKTKTLKQLSTFIEILHKHEARLPKTSIDIRNEHHSAHSDNNVHIFIRDVFFFDFYDVTRAKLKLSSRQEGKDLLFRLIFSPRLRNDKHTAKLRERYPTIVEIIEEFKKVKDNTNDEFIEHPEELSNLALFLQRIEAEIYINKIVQPLKKLQIPCASRHDSILVANGFEIEVEKHIKKVFNDFSFRYNQKVEDYLMDNYDYAELEDNLFLDWLIDENEIFDETSSVGDVENEDDEKGEEYFETMEKLREIGQIDDYFGLVDVDFLEELSQHQELTQQQKNWIYDDINNLHYGHHSLSKETNILLRYLLMG